MHDTAVQSVAAILGVAGEAVVPVHNLGNALNLAAESLSGVAKFSPISRLGTISATKKALSEAQPLRVDSSGYLEAEHVQAADWLVVQAGNQEIGSIDDLQRLREAASGARLMVDASEWVGRLTDAPAGDVLVLRASSWGGPQSVCFVVYRSVAPMLTSRKRQMLSPDSVLLATAVAALEQIGDVEARQVAHQQALVQLSEQLRLIDGVEVHADFGRPRLPHVLSFSVAGIDAEALARALDTRGFAVGAGSACIGELGQPSHVLAAMGRSGQGAIRLSLPIDTTPADLEAFASTTAQEIASIRG